MAVISMLGNCDPGIIRAFSRLILFSFLWIPVLQVHAQTDFRCDNIVYKTLYPAELCRFLAATPGALLIDARTPGEYSDTSAFQSLNIGHLNGAVNMEIDSIGKFLPELKKNMNRPLVVYCSHSQRSRRLSKMLKEEGFVHVYNVNGGLTWLNQLNSKEFPCKKEKILTALPYENIPAGKTTELIRSNKNLLIIDTRPHAAFTGTDTAEINNTGRLKNAINIPADSIEAGIRKTAAPRDRPILVYDENGDESNRAAKYLSAMGYTNVYHLPGGISALVGKDKETLKTRKDMMEGLPSYQVLNPREAAMLIKSKQGVVILDTRPVAEYTNKSDSKWKNLGHLKDAIHIDPSAFGTEIARLEKYKKAPLLIYGTRDAARYAKALKDMGFVNVNLLHGGLWNFVSSSFNVDGMQDLQSLLVDHNGLY